MLLRSLYLIKGAIQKSILLLLLILFSCSKGEDGFIEPISPEITSFAFLMEFNPTLIQDVNLTFDGVDTFSAAVNELCAIENLVASYTFIGGNVLVNSNAQVTGESSNNFNKPVIYVVSNIENSAIKSFYVEISYFTGLPRILIDTNNAPINSIAIPK